MKEILWISDEAAIDIDEISEICTYNPPYDPDNGKTYHSFICMKNGNARDCFLSVGDVLDKIVKSQKENRKG